MRQVLDAKDLTTNEKIYFKGHAKDADIVAALANHPLIRLASA
jgi:hypothetical protein